MQIRREIHTNSSDLGLARPEHPSGGGVGGGRGESCSSGGMVDRDARSIEE